MMTKMVLQSRVRMVVMVKEMMMRTVRAIIEMTTIRSCYNHSSI